MHARTQTDNRLLIYCTRPIIGVRVGVTSIAMLIHSTDTKVLRLTQCSVLSDEFCLFTFIISFLKE